MPASGLPALIAMASISSASIRSSLTSPASTSPVAIVGGGAAGTLLALHLTRLHGIRVTLYDGAGAFGRGAAYSATSPWHRLNVPAHKMGGWHADDADGFLQWLADRDGGTVQSHGHRYVERAVYGEWLSSHLFDAVRAGHVQLVTAQIQGLRVKPGGVARWELLLDNGQRHDAHAVALCQGNALPRALPGLANHPRSIGNPWLARSLSRIGKHDAVLVAGSGASGVDVVLELLHTGHCGRIHLVSRRALLPQPETMPTHPAAPRPFLFDPSRDPPALHDLYRTVRGAIGTDLAASRPWQPTMDAVLRQADVLWDGLTLVDRARFLRHVRPYWMVFRQRADPAALAHLQASQDSGQLRRTAARIASAAARDERLHVTLQRAGQPSATISADWVINATGPDERIALRDDPLIANLLRDGHARINDLGLGLHVTAEGEVPATKGRQTPALFALGLPTRGVFWEVTSVPALRARAAPLAARLAERLLRDGPR